MTADPKNAVRRLRVPGLSHGLPEHAYLPGLTGRHPAGRFEEIRKTARPNAKPDELMRSRAWQLGLAWLEAEYFWEAHELLEPVWMALPPASPERLVAEALIQIANAGLKRRMGRPRAVDRLAMLARDRIEQAFAGADAQIMGLSRGELVEKLARAMAGRA